MKFRKWMFLVLLVVAGLGVWGIASRGASAEGKVPEEKGTAAGGQERKAGGQTQTRKVSRTGAALESERAAMVKVREWLYATSMETSSREARIQMREMVKQLSLERVKALLRNRSTDPTYLDDPDAKDERVAADGEAGWRSFPYRLLLAAALWERYGSLAPEEALKEAFKEGESNWHRHHEKCSLLAGVAEADPERALGFLRNPPDEMHLGGSLDMVPLMKVLVRHSEKEAFGILPALDEATRPMAYEAFLMAMDPQWDWAAEAARLKGSMEAEGPFRFTSTYLGAAWARHDPAAAFAWMADQGTTQQGYQVAIGAWMEQDLTSAKAWLKDWQPPSGEPKSRYLEDVLQYVYSPSLEALDAVLELTDDQAARDRTAKLMASQWRMQMELGKTERDHFQNSPLISPEGKKAIEVLLK